MSRIIDEFLIYNKDNRIYDEYDTPSLSNETYIRQKKSWQETRWLVPELYWWIWCNKSVKKRPMYVKIILEKDPLMHTSVLPRP